MRLREFTCFSVLLCSAAAWCQSGSPKLRATTPATTANLGQKQQFVMDVVSAAVSVPQPDAVDRLRVLAAASSVITPIRPAMARQFSREGLRIERETIQRGEAPPTSMIAAGPVECSAVSSFAENIPATRVDAAEATLIAAIGHCPRVLQTVQRLITDGLSKRVIAPRLTMAAVDMAGARNEWSEQTVGTLFALLPPATHSAAGEAPDLAAMYSQVAGEMSVETVTRSGVELLAWLANLSPSKQRNLAVNIATGAMMERLGEEAYKRALATDVAALQAAGTSGQAGEVEVAPEESVSVLRAMQSADVDRSDDLAKMTPSLRAREAAASGFAAGSEGNGRLAQHYFDIAFMAVEDVWSGRSRQKDAADVVQEVSEAAAQVDPINALQRSQRLQDPAAQAIGMIAVARVVANR